MIAQCSRLLPIVMINSMTKSNKEGLNLAYTSPLFREAMAGGLRQTKRRDKKR